VAPKIRISHIAHTPLLQLLPQIFIGPVAMSLPAHAYIVFFGLPALMLTCAAIGILSNRFCNSASEQVAPPEEVAGSDLEGAAPAPVAEATVLSASPRNPLSEATPGSPPTSLPPIKKLAPIEMPGSPGGSMPPLAPIGSPTPLPPLPPRDGE
jgi:hypothetical protein